MTAAVQTCVQTLRNSQSEKLLKALQREADAQAQVIIRSGALSGALSGVR